MEEAGLTRRWAAVCHGLEREAREVGELRRDLLGSSVRGIDHLTRPLLDDTWLDRLFDAHTELTVLRTILAGIRENIARGDAYDVDALRATALEEVARRSREERLAELCGPIGTAPALKMIHLFDCHVAGTAYRSVDRVLCADGSVAVEAVEAEVAVGDALRLERESTNRWDDRSIRVLTRTDRWLGYVPRTKVEVAANLLDAGKQLGAVVDAVHRHDHGWLELRMGVFLIEEVVDPGRAYAPRG